MVMQQSELFIKTSSRFLANYFSYLINDITSFGFLIAFCSVDSKKHLTTAIYCPLCHGRRVAPELEVVDFTRSNHPNLTVVRKTASPGSRATQDHLNAANSKQARERKELAELQAGHAVSPALVSRPPSELPPLSQSKPGLQTIWINTTLWWSTHKPVTKRSKIKKPNQKETFIRKLVLHISSATYLIVARGFCIKVYNQVFTSLSEFLRLVISPWFEKFGLEEYANRLEELVPMTGPAVKSNLINSVICITDGVQTVKECCEGYLRLDKSCLWPSCSLPQHLSLRWMVFYESVAEMAETVLLLHL